MISPGELLRTKMQSSDKGGLTSTIKDIRQMMHLYGYRTLWRGLGSTLWRDVPFSGKTKIHNNNT